MAERKGHIMIEVRKDGGINTKVIGNLAYSDLVFGCELTIKKVLDASLARAHEKALSQDALKRKHD